MTTIDFNFPVCIPNCNKQFTCTTRYFVGYYSGSAFVRRGVYDDLKDAKEKCLRLQYGGFDAHIIEVDLNAYLLV